MNRGLFGALPSLLILAYLGERTQAPHVAPAARGPPHGKEDFDTREGDTFA